jgi:hypothetical protein
MDCGLMEKLSRSCGIVWGLFNESFCHHAGFRGRGLIPMFKASLFSVNSRMCSLNKRHFIDQSISRPSDRSPAQPTEPDFKLASHSYMVICLACSYRGNAISARRGQKVFGQRQGAIGLRSSFSVCHTFIGIAIAPASSSHSDPPFPTPVLSDGDPAAIRVPGLSDLSLSETDAALLRQKSASLLRCVTLRIPRVENHPKPEPSQIVGFPARRAKPSNA